MDHRRGFQRNRWGINKRNETKVPEETLKSKPLQQSIDKHGRVLTNYLEWRRDWNNIRITDYPNHYQNILISEEREPVVDEVAVLDEFIPESEQDVAREFWVPNAEERLELAAIEDPDTRRFRETEMYLFWREPRVEV
jgi:hypothetical protein